MNELWGHLTGVIIVVMLFTFICIWAWAWSGRHKKAFSRMAELPMEDEPANDQPMISTNAKDAQP